MRKIFFGVKILPDLTLSKYASLGENGIEGVVTRHNSFLRLWHRIALLINASIHLYIIYNPKYNNGNKFRIGMLLHIKDDEFDDEKIIKILKASPLSEYYYFEKMDFPVQNLYSNKSILYRKERFLNQAKNENGPDMFYVVPRWEVNDEARLIDMLHIIEALDEEITYRVDIYPEELTETMHQVFEKPLAWLREKNGSRSGNEINLTGEKTYVNKDPNIAETLKQYEEFLKETDMSPSFYCNITCYSNSKENCHLVLDAAASESIISGEYRIKDFSGENDCFRDVDKGMEICFFFFFKVQKQLEKLSIVYSLDDISPFFRLPVLYDGENIEMPKETNPILGSDGLLLGRDSAGYEVRLPLELLPKHAFISGVPGSGKTNTMLHIAYELWNTYEIPFLVLEPAKQEYRALTTSDIQGLLLFSPSAKTKFPLMINPFEFPVGITLSEHIRNLMQVFEGAFSLFPPMPFLLDRAIENIYRLHKWLPNTVNNGTLEYPIMSELYEQLREEIELANYQGETSANMRAALEMRIGSLLRREMGSVFDVRKSSLRPEEWLEKPVIIELETMGTGPANFTTLLLCTLIRETLKANSVVKNNKPVRHVIFIEEAHNLIGSESEEVSGEEANPKIAATAFIVKMLAEVRALKEGIIIADQLPTAMAPEIMKNTGLKVAQRMTSADDRQLLGTSMSATGLQLEQMASFTPGQALITYEKIIKPFNVQIEKTVGVVVKDETPNDKETFNVLSKQIEFQRLCYENQKIICEKYYDFLDNKLKKCKKLLQEEQEILNSISNNPNMTLEKKRKVFDWFEIKYQQVKKLTTEMIEANGKMRNDLVEINMYTREFDEITMKEVEIKRNQNLTMHKCMEEILKEGISY